MALLALLLIITAGCTTRTAGMQAPLGHDYDGIRWRPLDTSVTQAFVVAPAYTALVENDPKTDVTVLRGRIDDLPDDVRESELVELRVAVRPAEDSPFDKDSTLQVRRIEGGDALFSSPLVDLTYDGEWAVIEDLPAVEAGARLVIELRPASGESGWEFGYAAGQLPYGGAPGLLDFESPTPVELSGALGFQTVFAQRTNTRDVVAASLDSIADGLFGDVLLLAIYSVALLAGAFVVVAHRSGYGRVEQSGR